jgi:plasmid stabilization system protein ParE
VARSSVVWTVPARRDLWSAVEYLARDAESPDAALRLLKQLGVAAASLGEFPNRGRVVPELGLPRRELIVGRYRMISRFGARVEILRIIHGRQEFNRTWRRKPRR